MRLRVATRSASAIVLAASLLGGGHASFGQTRGSGVSAADEAGLSLGERIPDFRIADQDGRLQTFDSMRGPKGAVIYFHRSASWCIYCRGQLVQLEESRAAIERNGLAVFAISYDGVPALREFAREKKISFPLLSDPQSKTIRAFKVLDTTVRPDNPAYGVPYHGLYVVDDDGVVVSKLFEGGIGHAVGIVLTRLFGSPSNTHEKLVRYDHLSLRYYASSNSTAAGDSIRLTIEVLLNDKVHVYGPGVKRYAAVSWALQPSSAFSARAVEYPAPEVVTLGRAHEKVPVYRGAVKLERSVTFNADSRALAAQLGPAGDLSIKGTFRFQACDETTCYIPLSIPLDWRLAIARR
jgi:peroxiredoxin